MKKIKKIAFLAALLLNIQAFAVEEDKNDNDPKEIFDPLRIKNFKETPAVVELKGPLVLKAIVISDDKDKAIAIIQDRLFMVGDVINEYKIIEIEKNKVHLLDNNQNASILTLY